MKTMIKSIALIAIAALSLAACSKKEAPINDENEMITLKFNIKNADDASTRALLGTENGKKFLNWENGDLIGSFATGTFGTNTASSNNSGTVKVDGDTYTLNIQTFWSGNATNVYTYFPFSAAAGKTKEAAVMTIPATQEMTADGFNADAMPMAGSPISVNLDIAEANKDVPCGEINFYNLGSIINFRIYSSVATAETLTSVKYVAESGSLGGTYTIDLTSISSSETSLALSSKDPVNEITTVVSTNPAIGTGTNNAIDVYMVVAPGTYTNTQVVVTTSAHTYTLNASGAKTFTRSSVKPMSVDIQNGEVGSLPDAETWNPVTTVSDFIPGTYYIVSSDDAYYLPNTVSSSGAPATTAMPAGGRVTDAMKWVATSSGQGLVFESYSHPGNYLWGFNDNNGIRIAPSSTASGNSKVWTAVKNDEFGGSHNGVIATFGSDRYLTMYGTQDWRCYKITVKDGVNVLGVATNKAAIFYRLEDGRTPLATPILSVDNAVVSWDAIANADHYEVTVNEVSEDVTSTIYDLSSRPEGEYTVSVVAVPSNTAAQYMNSAAATVTITIGNPLGTASNPYTVAQAKAAIDAGEGITGVYVKGIISEIVTAYSSQYKNITFNISADGSTSGDQIQAFRATASSATDFAVGDGVLMKGNLKKYNGTYELDAACTAEDKVHMPSLTPSDGTEFSSSLEVSISTATGVVVRYTTDGSTPDMESTQYTSPLSLTATTTVKAIAFSGLIQSAVASATYTKNEEAYETLEFTYSSHTGWTISSGADDKNSYYLLKNSSYIDSPEFSFTSIKSVKVTLRSFGGIQYGPINIMYGDTVIGHQDSATATLTEYTIDITSPDAGTGALRFIGQNTTTANGPGISKIVITYK